jgi:hypothetical protein
VTYTLADLIEGHEQEERAVVFVPHGEKSVIRFIGMDRGELVAYLADVVLELHSGAEIDAHLRRIAGSERKQ